MDQGDTSSNPKLFRLPSRAELEERRKQLEADKPTLHFKPSTPTSASSTASTGQSTQNATNSASTNGPTHAAPSINYTHAVANRDNSNNKSMNSQSTIGALPGIMSSRQHYQQQQQQQQHAQKNVHSRYTSDDNNNDDDFGFGDDLGDVILDDDLFDTDGPSMKLSSATSTASTISTPASTLASTSGSASERTTTTATHADNSTSVIVAPPAFTPKSKSTIVVKSSQRGNPLLQFIRNVPYEYGDIVPDFVVGLTSCVLFLSIRYHRLHPEYIFNRIAALGKTFVLRVILVLVDVDTHQQAIRELTRVAMVNDLTLICAWSNEEAARYIETFKAYENKAPDAIKERVENDYLSKLTDCLTQIQSINKTDVITLSSTFGSFRSIMNASVDELGVLPGFGERKVKRLLEAFDQPFAIDPKKRRHRR
ncbi:ssDNA endonuclease and repair protein rad10 [Haplosporangium sp. Z 767]|nr:ssDNA endonuclease and repair protein rad10 [Haplosporangium sp. Z 767]KAF9196416.1 ssDNA endonuclease and repair protein rad10 [Haplosporangium sp. Z 11]